MSKSKKEINKGISDSEISAKYDNGENAKSDFDKIIKTFSKTKSASSIAKPKR